MHKILYFVAVICILAMAQGVYAARHKSKSYMDYTQYFENHKFQTVQAQDYQHFVRFVKKASRQKDIPGYETGSLVRRDFRKWFEEENLERNNRQRSIYHLFGITSTKQDQSPTLIGYVQLGSLPVFAADLEPLIFSFVKDKNEAGIATFLPIFKDDCTKDEIVHALKDVVRFVSALRARREKLPFERTLPSYLVGFFSYSKPFIRLLEKAGFNYTVYADVEDQVRVLAYHPIKDEKPEPPCPRISPSCRKIIESL